MMMNSKFNTVKEKLSQGKQVVGGTIKTADTENYLAMANAGFDFIWYFILHSIDKAFHCIDHKKIVCKIVPNTPGKYFKKTRVTGRSEIHKMRYCKGFIFI